MTRDDEQPRVRLTEVCWPVFDFLINFVRLLKHGAPPPPDQVRYEALTALRDAEERALDDAAAERLWHDRVKPMLVYLIDYRMLNSEWDGRDFWFDNRFETDPDVLDNIEALGGEKFFDDCDEMQREYELAERRDRPDKDGLAELLSLYFICLRLGFRGKYHDRPQELADYTRRLFTRLPAYGSTRTKEMFPESYRHNQEVKVDYKLGQNVAVVLTATALVVVAALVMFRVAWSSAVNDIDTAAQQLMETTPAGPAESAKAAEAATRAADDQDAATDAR